MLPRRTRKIPKKTLRNQIGFVANQIARAVVGKKISLPVAHNVNLRLKADTCKVVYLPGKNSPGKFVFEVEVHYGGDKRAYQVGVGAFRDTVDLESYGHLVKYLW